MKRKIILLSILLLCGSLVKNVNAQAENFRAVRADFGPVIPLGLEGFAIGWFTAIKYNITDQIAVGIRWEADAGLSVSSTSASATGVTSFGLKGDYYFNTNYPVRPFAGLGINYYATAGGSASVTGGSAQAGTHVGFMPQVGVSLGHFRLALEYNLILGKDQVLVTAGTPTKTGRSFAGIDIGFTIGGGQK